MKKLMSAAICLLYLSTLFGSCSVIPKTESIAPAPESAAPQVAMGRYIEEDITPKFLFTNNSRSGESINIGADGTLYASVHVDNKCSYTSYANGKWSEPECFINNSYKAVSQKYLNSDEPYLQTENKNELTVEKIGMIVERIGPAGEIFTPLNYYKLVSDKNTGAYIEGEGNYKNVNYYISFSKDGCIQYDLPELSKAETRLLTEAEQTEKMQQSSLAFGKARITRDYILIVPFGEQIKFYNLSGGLCVPLGEIPAEVLKDESGFDVYTKAAISGDSVLLANKNGVKLYSLESKKLLAEIDLKDIDAVCEGADGAFYAAGKSGIWRITNGGLHERVMDGTEYAFAAPSKTIQEIAFAADGTFYIRTFATGNGQKGYYKYTFSPSTPLNREKLLYVWTLRNSESISETASVYMRKFPDTRVYIEEGAKNATREAEQTALKTLFESIKNGKGPDVIYTDGISLQELYNNTALMPLPQTVNTDICAEIVLKQGAINGEQYAVAGRAKTPFIQNNVYRENTVPRLYSLSENLNSLQNADLSTAINSMEGDKNLIFKFFNREEVISCVYMASAPEIWAEDKLNKKALSDYLQICKVLNDRYLEEYFHPNAYAQYLVWLNSAISVNLANPQTYFQQSPFLGLYNNAAIQLSNIAAVGYGAKNQEAAAEYINVMLSLESQSVLFGDGSPAISLPRINDNGEEELSLPQVALFKNGESDTDLVILTVVTYAPQYKRDREITALTEDFLSGTITLEQALEKAEKTAA